MRLPILRLLAPGLFALVALFLAAGRPADAAGTVVTIDTAAGGHYSFQVELARTEAEQEQGLMNRTSLPANAGMLFLFNPPQPVNFWMKDTLIPLDMLFIAPDGRIIAIKERATPRSLTPIPSGGTVAAVLEVNGGIAQTLGVRKGDKVRLPDE